MWFDAWSGIARVALVGGAAYVTLILVLRVAGKRTLAKLNAYDLVVTVALGSTLATILLSSEVTWAEGATALGLLALLQYVAASVSRRWPRARTVLTAEPTYLLRDGALLEDAMRQQRVAVAEVRQAVRNSGGGALEDVAAVVLETDGTLSVISAGKRGTGSALRDVRGPDA